MHHRPRQRRRGAVYGSSKELAGHDGKLTSSRVRRGQWHQLVRRLRASVMSVPPWPSAAVTKLAAREVIEKCARELCPTLVQLGAAPELPVPSGWWQRDYRFPALGQPSAIRSPDWRAWGALRRTISRRIVELVRTPVILAGGLGPDNVAEAILVVRPAGVDSKTKTDQSGSLTCECAITAERPATVWPLPAALDRWAIASPHDVTRGSTPA